MSAPTLATITQLIIESWLATSSVTSLLTMCQPTLATITQLIVENWLATSSVNRYICSLAVSPFGTCCTSAVREIGLQHALDAGELCNEWVAFSKQHNDCDMDTESLDRWENQVSYIWLLFCDNSHPLSVSSFLLFFLLS